MPDGLVEMWQLNLTTTQSLHLPSTLRSEIGELL